MAMIGRFFQDPGSHYFLFGPRGTGKSTWLQQEYPDALRIDLLRPETARSLAARPERLEELVAGHPDRSVVVVDEVQKVPALLDVVHDLIERRDGPRFVLTGSSARKLKRGGADLLAGRAVRRSMHPFMAAELGERFVLEDALLHGLVPVVWDAEDPQSVLDAYVGLYLKEEVQVEGLVREIGHFARFLEAARFSQASVLNASAIARECEVSRKTVTGYLEVFQDLLLGFLVPVFTRRARRHLSSHPKFYWFDVGVWRSVRPRGPLDRPEEITGGALEGLVAQHLRAWIDHARIDLELHFWRTKSGVEVDFVLYGGDGFHALEVKASRRVDPRALRGLKAFREDYPEASVCLLHLGADRVVIDGIPCLPVQEFLPALVPGAPWPGVV